VRVSLVHNPDAGDGRTTKAELVAALRAAGHDVRYHRSSARGVAAALRERPDAIVVAGGDGTVGRVALARADRSVPIAVLALGTANNVAWALGVAERPWRETIDGLAAARVRTVDVGHMRTPGGTREFLESAGVGLVAELLRDAERRVGPADTDAIDAGRARVLDVLDRAVPRWHTIDADGADLSGEYLMVEALTLPAVGPRLVLAPDARADDGLLHLVCVGAGERDALRAYVQALREGAPVTPLRARAVRVVRLSVRGAESHVDDERWPAADESDDEPLHATIAAADGAPVRFLVP